MANTIQPDYHYHLKNASNPAISPDDSTVAFIVHRFDENSNEASTDLFTTRLDDSGALDQLTNSGSAANPVWSPGGRQIAYIDLDDAGIKQIFVQWFDSGGSEPSKLTHRLADVDAVTWSPNGRRIAFRSLVLGPDEL